MHSTVAEISQLAPGLGILHAISVAIHTVIAMSLSTSRQCNIKPFQLVGHAILDLMLLDRFWLGPFWVEGFWRPLARA